MNVCMSNYVFTMFSIAVQYVEEHSSEEVANKNLQLND